MRTIALDKYIRVSDRVERDSDVFPNECFFSMFTSKFACKALSNFSERLDSPGSDGCCGCLWPAVPPGF